MLTAQEIDALKPGRDLDALIGECVLGYVRLKVPPDADGANGGNDVLVPGGALPEGYEYPPKGHIGLAWFCRQWSTRESDALELLRMLERWNYNWMLLGPARVKQGRMTNFLDMVCCCLSKDPHQPWEREWRGYGHDLAEAISKAALLTAMEPNR